MAEASKSSSKAQAAPAKPGETAAADLRVGAAGPFPYGTAIGGEIDYDSDWVYDTNATVHQTIFRHNLLVVPTVITVWFSPNGGNTVYPVMFRWDQPNTGNPVTIDLTDKEIVLNIVGGTPLHGNWTAIGAGTWTRYNTGFWRVFAWR